MESFCCYFGVCKLSDSLHMPLCLYLYLWFSQSFTGHSTSPRIVIHYLKPTELKSKFHPFTAGHYLFSIHKLSSGSARQRSGIAAAKRWSKPFTSTLQADSHPQTLVGESYWAVNTPWTSGSFRMLKEVLQFYSSDLHIALWRLSSQLASFYNNSGTYYEIWNSAKFKQTSCWVWHLGS